MSHESFHHDDLLVTLREDLEGQVSSHLSKLGYHHETLTIKQIALYACSVVAELPT